MALVNVLRAAVSEIEQYERVIPDMQPGISVRGQAVNDVVHLLSELAENATTFSPADTLVHVSGYSLNSGGVLLDITDQGVGMGAEEMAHANWRLDNPPVVDVAVSRRMGLFVVARLAARHGIHVRLRPASKGGLTALVWLPDEVVTRETPASLADLRPLGGGPARRPRLHGWRRAWPSRGPTSLRLFPGPRGTCARAPRGRLTAVPSQPGPSQPVPGQRRPVSPGPGRPGQPGRRRGRRLRPGPAQRTGRPAGR